MTNKDVFKILLCSYGYDRNIKIETYYGDGGWLGYDIYAENDKGEAYSEVNCEGFLFHVHEILSFIGESQAKQKTLFWNYPIKMLLNDTDRECIIAKDDYEKEEHKHWCETMKPAHDWEKESHPCKTCVIKQDYEDLIHYNCWLCHTGDCDILKKFCKERDEKRKECRENL